MSPNHYWLYLGHCGELSDISAIREPYRPQIPY